MKRILFILSAIMLTFSNGTTYAQNNSKENEYNLYKAYEALNEYKDYDKAMDLSEKITMH